MFNNCNYITNGELNFYKKIKDNISIIFDVGCRDDSIFLDFKGSVHYFDPNTKFIDILESKPHNNICNKYNKCGLGNENNIIPYYPHYESFVNRVKSCNVNDESNKVLLTIRKSIDYIIDNNIDFIDFLKIDTEGYELSVLQGFESFIKNINIIQFEYGGTFIDNNIKLIDIINYLRTNGFDKFSYLTPNGVELITDFTDHYQYCNIVCINNNSTYIPF